MKIFLTLVFKLFFRAPCEHSPTALKHSTNCDMKPVAFASYSSYFFLIKYCFWRLWCIGITAVYVLICLTCARNESPRRKRRGILVE
jgi:hypothetical protein